MEAASEVDNESPSHTVNAEPNPTPSLVLKLSLG